MNHKKKKIGLIALILGLSVTASVAFAAFTGVLTINGTAELLGNPFKMVFVNADGTDVVDNTIPASSADLSGDAEASDITVSADGTQISAFNVKLYKTGDIVTYKFKIKNTGGATAYLDEVSIAKTTASPTGLDLTYLQYSLALSDGSATMNMESLAGSAVAATPGDGQRITVASNAAVDCTLTVSANDDALFAGADNNQGTASDNNVTLTLGAITITWTSVDPSQAAAG